MEPRGPLAVWEVLLACGVPTTAMLVCLGGVVGLGLLLWQVVDALHTNTQLMSLATEVTRDNKLQASIFVFLVFFVLAVCFGAAVSKSRREEGEGEGEQARTSCLSIGVSLLLIAGYLASGFLALHYRTHTLPHLNATLQDALNNREYLIPGSNTSSEAPSYPPLGEYFNRVQYKYQCCGVSQPGGGDYVSFQQRYNITIPYSCCTLKEGEDWHNLSLHSVEDYTRCCQLEPHYFHQDTCYTTLHSWLQFKAEFFLIYTLCFVALNLLPILVYYGTHLRKSFRARYDLMRLCGLSSHKKDRHMEEWHPV